MKKLIYMALALIAFGFMSVKFMGIDSFDWVYMLARIAVLTYASARCFKRALRLGDRDALFTGALGLGVLTMSEIFLFAKTLAGERGQGGLIISDYSDAGSYLFFLAVTAMLLIPPVKWEKALRAGMTAASGVIILVTLYSVLVNSEKLLYITVAATALLCVLLSAYLLAQTRRVRLLKTAARFAASMIFLGVLDLALYLLAFFGNLHAAGVLASLYLPSFFFIGEGLMRLRGEENRHG